MLKLVTDPQTTPVAELDLYDSLTGTYPIFTTPGNAWNKSITWDTPDGETLVYHRAPRTKLSITLRHFTEEMYTKYIALRDSGKPVYVLPDFDKNTSVYLPFSASTKGLIRQSDRSIDPTDATIATRAGAAYYKDADNKIYSAAVDEIRFNPAGYGKGLIVESGVNSFLNYPKNDNVGAWTYYAGPTCSFSLDTASETIGTDFTSTLKAYTTAGQYPTIYTSGMINTINRTGAGSNGLGYYTGAMYARGTALVQLAMALEGVDAGIGSYQVTAAPQVQLTPDEWTLLRVEGPASFIDLFAICFGATKVRATLQLEIDNPGGVNYGQTVYLGPAQVKYSPYGLATFESLPMWSDSSASSYDIVQYTDIKHVEGAATIVVCGTIPYEKDAGWIWGFTDGVGNRLALGWYANETSGTLHNRLRIEFKPNEPTYANPVVVTLPASGSFTGFDLDDYHNEPFHLLWQVLADGGFRVRLTVWDSTYVDACGKNGRVLVLIDEEIGKAYAPTKYSPLYGDCSTLTFGGTDAVLSSRSQSNFEAVGIPHPINHFRYDLRKWTDAEIAQHEKLLLEPVFKETLLNTIGRRFRIVGDNLDPVNMRGTINLEEIDADADLKLDL